MSKPIIAYLLMIVGLVVGLWIILSVGSRLHAPADLRGIWYPCQAAPMESATAPHSHIVSPRPDSAESHFRRLIVDQSGLYISVKLEDAQSHLVALDGHFTHRGPAPGTLGGKLTSPDKRWQLVVDAYSGTNRLSGTLLTPTAPAPSRSSPAVNHAKPRETRPTRRTNDQSRMHSPLLTLFLQIGLILALSRVVAIICTRLSQPQVMGEMIAGIMLGPSLFGLLFPKAFAAVFPVATAAHPVNSIEYLNILSEVGITFFLFLIGLELDPKLIRNRGHAAVIISHMSIIVPFLLGAGCTLFLYPRVFSNAPTMRFSSAALFMGTAMSITAFPVLARILTERNLHKTRIGAVTITCAAVDDVTAWCMLAFVVGVARVEAGHHGLNAALATLFYAAAYVAVMFFIIKPLLSRLEIVYERQGRLSQNVVAIVFLLILASAYATEAIGIHALFGAFLMGCIMPKGTQFVRHISEKLEDYTVVFFLPIFFAYTGLNTQIGLLNHAGLWIDTLLLIFVACLGKFGGSAVAARICGLSWRESSAVGVLMNTRGLMELIILNIGRDLGVISNAVFAMMVIMALVTTGLTTPVLNWVYPKRLLEEEQKSAGGVRRAFSILVPVSLPKTGGPLVQLADMMMNGRGEEGKLYALHLRRPVDHAAYRSGLDEIDTPQDEALAPLMAQARARNLSVESLSFVSQDVAGDITNIARTRGVDLVLMGFHKPVIGKAILGGTVHRVLTHTETDVAIFVDRGFRQAHRILVPYLGSVHDRLAMELASRMARRGDAQVTVIHVVPPLRGDASRTLDAHRTVERIFSEPNHQPQVTFRVIEDSSPVGVVLHQARQYDLVVIGVAEEWGLESHLFGWRTERIASDCPSSLLLVRKCPRHPTAPEEAASV